MSEAALGSGVSNELIHPALDPYADDLVLVSKVGAVRDESGGPAQTPADLRIGVEDNLRSLQAKQLDRCTEAGIASVAYSALGSAFPDLPKVIEQPQVIEIAASRRYAGPGRTCLAAAAGRERAPHPRGRPRSCTSRST